MQRHSAAAASKLALAVLLLAFCAGCAGLQDDRDKQQFFDNRDEYEAAVQWVDDELSDHGTSVLSFDHMRLPKEFATLSADGEVFVSENGGNADAVGFYTFRGILGSAREIYYTADDAAAPTGTSVERLAEHWYLLVSE